MDVEHWLSIAGGAGVGLMGGGAGVYFYVRRSLSAARKQEIDDAADGWRKLVDYKTEDYRKRSVSQDEMISKMRAEMQVIHEAHMKCERDGMEREISYKRSVLEKEMQLKQHEMRIVELTDKIDRLGGQVQVISAKQIFSDSHTTDVEKIAVMAADKLKVDHAAETKELERLRIHKEKQQEQIAMNVKEIEQIKNSIQKKLEG